MINPLQYAQALFHSTKDNGEKEMRTKTDNMLKLLWQTGAWKQLPAIVKALQDVVNKENGVVEVVVKSARKIPQEELDAQRETIVEMAKKFSAGAERGLPAPTSIVFKNEVDPNLVGGVVLLIHGVRIDGSILSQLEKFKDAQW